MTQETPKRDDAFLDPMDRVEPKAPPVVYMARAFKSEQEKADWIKSIHTSPPTSRAWHLIPQGSEGSRTAFPIDAFDADRMDGFCEPKTEK